MVSFALDIVKFLLIYRYLQNIYWFKRETSSFLIAVMPVMFIPAAVGLIDSWASVSQAWFQYIIVTVISTFIVMGVSGMLTQYVIRKGKEKKQ